MSEKITVEFEKIELSKCSEEQLFKCPECTEESSLIYDQSNEFFYCTNSDCNEDFDKEKLQGIAKESLAKIALLEKFNEVYQKMIHFVE